jgi:hypothetical protein
MRAADLLLDDGGRVGSGGIDCQLRAQFAWRARFAGVDIDGHQQPHGDRLLNRDELQAADARYGKPVPRPRARDANAPCRP